MFVIISGNVIQGIQLYGPFEEAEEATEWAFAEIDEDWHLAPVIDPEDV